MLKHHLRILCLATLIFITTEYRFSSTQPSSNVKNFNANIKCLELTKKHFEDTILKPIADNRECCAAQNATLYFNVLRQNQMDIVSNLKDLKKSLDNLRVSSELFKNTNSSSSREKIKSHTQLLPNDSRNEKNLNPAQDYDEHLNCLKNCSAIDKLPRTCAEATVANIFKDDIYTLHIPNSDLPPFYAYCIYESKNENSWTIIQRRSDGSESFYRNWTDYKNGFGDLSGEYWLGLERMHQLTRDQPHELWIFLVNKENEKRFVKYSHFTIASEDEGYKLTFKNSSGNAGDAFNQHNNLKFSTYDRDNKIGCAKYFGSGWWYKECFHCNLNGIYSTLPKAKLYDGIRWNTEDMDLIKYVHMAIRARVF